MDIGNDYARRMHRKSRSGCLPCKSRHIKCDEFQPQCRNCTKRASTCQYPSPNLLHDKKTGPVCLPLSPFDQVQQDSWLLQHLLFVSANLETSNSGNLLTVFVQLSTSHEIVRHSLLSLSASHLGWINRSSELDNIAAIHQTSAYSTLQAAVNTFNQDNADAVFAATMILSWQAQDWRSWAALIKGETAVVNAMRPWITNSIFSAPLIEHLKEADLAPPILAMPYRPLPGESMRLRLCIDSLQRAEAFMSTTEEHSQLHKGLLDFAQNLQSFPPGHTASEQFRLVYPLRGWLFWLPKSFLEVEKKDLHVIVCFAFYNATVLTVKPFFPAVGTVFYRKTQTNAIMEIHLYLQRLKSGNPLDATSELDAALSLVGDCVKIAGDHWNGWNEGQEQVRSRAQEARGPLEPMKLRQTSWEDFSGPSLDE